MLSGCSPSRPGFTAAIAQPNARPARNFTSFSGALRCMDGLLAQLPKRRYLVSSSDIPDQTRAVSVGADDMLINALNQMNRTSQRYVFLDQARISGFGQLELITTRKKGEVKPDLYIRGSISQLDSDTAEQNISLGSDSSRVTGLKTSLYRDSRTLSVVSVDLHLVQYPSRRVLPGGSVSNSMVVTKRGLTGTIAGVINAATVAVPITINRVESEGQAVRNLVELGLIELLGQHAGVPYWHCLAAPSTDARAAEKRERKHVVTGADMRAIQANLITLGYLQGAPSGTLDTGTRRAISKFQTAQNLLPNGTPDFDLVERLQSLAAAKAPTPRAVVPAPQAPTKTIRATAGKPAPAIAAANPAAPNVATSPQCTADGTPACEDIYKNLYDFIKDDIGF
ncbi:peptidoglycan-binding protein [Shimia sp.]|uniref:peptidoglycan-binding protein n=1 Tax=Shimia sp. TaxID=1954381 RepID=UPI003B8B5D9C